MTYAIIKRIKKVGQVESCTIVGYADNYTEADYAIYRLAINAQYGGVEKGFHAVFSVCKM